MDSLTPDQLRSVASETLLLDVRLEDDFACGHVPGAINNCVFEVAFADRLAPHLHLKDKPVCVYGQSDTSHEAAMAAEKLRRAGFARVHLLQGGLQGWRDAGLPVEGKGAEPASPAIPQGRKEIDLQESHLEWTGRNLLNKHSGKIALKSGHLTFNHGAVTGGEIVISMADITCDDLQGTPLHDVLVHHLRSDDFFDTDRYPVARLIIHEARPMVESTPGSPNLHVLAALTIKDVTAPLEFTASAGLDDQGRAAAQAAFAIDRTRWGVLYGSGKFFHRLAGHLVNDLIELQVRLVCVR